MTVHFQEVVRSEVEGGLAGPANPIPSQSIDCGCGQLPCPRLARFATRRLYVGLMSWVGLAQAAVYVYLYVAGPTIARRFQLDPYIMEWVLAVSDLTPFILGILIAYWGDRIHRVAWIGGIVLLQSVSYFIMIIPHLTDETKVIEETENVTHMSLYADDSRELCLDVSSRIIGKEDGPRYLVLAIIIVLQIVNGVANIAYYTLGISYLDDNMKKKHVAAFIGVLVAMKIIGTLFGYILAWGCLRIDAVTLRPIESYREQIGAWWLGLVIFTVLFVVPGLLLSWFPRMLPSQVVKRAAASLLSSSDRYNRAPRTTTNKKFGSPNFWPSLYRLFFNKILMCNTFACALYLMAIVNFMSYENLIAQSRFHIPKLTGTFLGYGDLMSFSLMSNILKPTLVGLIVIISGLVIAKVKLSARNVTAYNIGAILVAAGIIFSLSATVCEREPIVGTDNRGSLVLLQYCNKHCSCSNDADFRPVCDSKGTFTFYSACHAGCTSSELKNGVTTYNDCSCVREMTGLENAEAVDGACNLNKCQISWLTFKFGAMLAYALVASTFVGDLLIVLRSVYPQDKAIGMSFWMTWSTVIMTVPGKILYDVIASLTCRYWGTQQTACRLHDSLLLGNYLCYVTGSLLTLCALLKVLVWLFCKDLKLYFEKEEVTPITEMQELMRDSAAPSNLQTKQPDAEHDDDTSVRVQATNETTTSNSTTSRNKDREEDEKEEGEENEVTPMKYGPLGPGDRRTDSKSSLNRVAQNRNADTEDELSSSDDEGGRKDSSPKVAYRPLDFDSDIENDLSNVAPRSRKRIPSKEYDSFYKTDQSVPPKHEFPNPDNYGDPRLNRRAEHEDRSNYKDVSSRTNSFVYSGKGQSDEVQTKGDFNEVGIPIVYPRGTGSSRSDKRFLNDVKSLINRYELNAEQQANVGEQKLAKSSVSGSHFEGKLVSGIPLVAMAPNRPSSRNHSSSGFNSSADGKLPEGRSESRESDSPKTSSRGSVGTLHTDF